MFIWRLICQSRRRIRWQWIFFLAFLMPLIVTSILGHIFDYSKSWSYAVLLGELVLFLSVDRIIRRILFRALWKKMTPQRVLYSIDLESRKDVMAIMESCTFYYLTAMALRIQQLTEEQRIYAETVKLFPLPGSEPAQAMVTNDLVAHALKDFWRVHWLARALRIDVYFSWRHYVDPDWQKMRRTKVR